MSSAIKRSGSVVFSFILALILLVSGSVLSVRAAEAKTISLPVSYANKISDVPAGLGENVLNTVDVVATLSTEKIGEGTVITLSGIPSDCINFQADKKYTVVISEGDKVSTTYGGWYKGESYQDGMISYVVKTDAKEITISFGNWETKYNSGQDACYLIGNDGSVNIK